MPVPSETEFANRLQSALSAAQRGQTSVGSNPWDDLYDGASDSKSVLRLQSLESDFSTFARAVRLLIKWHREVFPAVHFDTGPLPVNPTNQRFILSDDPVSTALRDQWQPHAPAVAYVAPTTEGSPTQMPIDLAIDTFCSGIAPSAVAGASRGLTIVRFTVNSIASSYRIHYTDRYWHNPLVFGSKTSSPVTDNLLPSHYKFGGDLDNINIIWDKGIHQVASTRTQTTLKAF